MKLITCEEEILLKIDAHLFDHVPDSAPKNNVAEFE
jgi:hypothetical protein